MATSTASNHSSVAHYTGNFYFRDGALLTGVLATLLYLIVAVSLDAAGHVPNMVLLIPVTLGATMLGVLMSYSRFDGFFALSHSMFTGLAWILFLMAGLVAENEIESFLDFGIPELQAKVYFVLWKLLNWMDAALSNRASNDNYVFIFEICFLVWWLTYLGIWSIFRYGYTWRAIIPAGVVLLINTYYAPKPVVGFLISFSLVALIFLVRTNLAEQQLRWRDQRIYFNQDIAFDFLRNGLFYSLVVLAIAWLPSGMGRNPYIRELMAPLNERWEETNQRVSELYSGLARQARPRESTFGQTLSLGGERTVEDSLVFTVQTSSSARYWRAVAFDTFNGRQWENTLESETDFDADALLPTPNWLLRKTVTQTIQLLAPTGNVIFAPPDLRRVNVPLEVLGQPAPIDALGAVVQDPNQGPPPGLEITFARSRRELTAGDSYTIISQYADVTRRALEEAPTTYSQAILDKYLQLPENFSQRIAQTAITVTAGLETPYAKAKAIETYLRTIPYNDAIPAPPPEVDPIEYFLYDIVEGYCDYYATAMVLMLRSLGVPSRAVSGYAEGAYDEESGLYFVTDRDAHTWVEVFFPDLGWIEFEPTAGESPLERPEGSDASTASQPLGAPTDTSGLSNPPIDPFLENMQDPMMDDMMVGMEQTTNSMASRWWLWALLTPLILGLGLLGLRRTQIFGPTAFTPELPPILFERLQRWAARLGLRSQASETPYEQASHIGRALPEGQAFIKVITDGYVRYRFRRLGTENGDRSVPAESVNPALVSAWQQLHPVLWRAWGRRVFGLVWPRKNSDSPRLRKPSV